MKKSTVLLFVFLLPFLASCAAFKKNYLQDPQVEVKEVVVQDVSAQDVLLHLNLDVENPNKIPIEVGRISYELFLAGHQATQGTFTEGVRVPAQGKSNVVIPLRFKYESLGAIVKSFLGGKSSQNYQIKGTAQIGPFTLPFAKAGEVDLTP